MLAYAVPLTVFVRPCGALIGRFPSLPLFLVALGGFAVSTATCGLAPSLAVLVVGRVLQGSAGALISTLGFAVAAGVVRPSERGRAIGIVGSLAPLGAIAGPGIGGQILAHGSWPGVFFVNLPVSVVAALLGAFSLRWFRLLARPPAPSTQRSGSQMGRLPRLPDPCPSGRLPGKRDDCRRVLLLLPFDLSGVQRLPASASGIVLLFMPLGMGVVGMLAVFLSDRLGSRPVDLLGGAVIRGDLALITAVLTRPLPVSATAWRLTVLGIGMGVFNSPIQTILMSTGGRESIAAASAPSNLSARIGSVLGPLLVAALWSFVPGLPGQMRGGGVLVLCLAFLALGSTLVIAARGPATGREKPG
jgi:hypothetical protein